MALLTFKGGIHPDDGKSLAKDKAIVDVKPKGDLVYPVSQHIGAPANPVVAVGDHVLKGQMRRIRICSDLCICIWNCKSNRTTSESDRRKSKQYRDRK